MSAPSNNISWNIEDTRLWIHEISLQLEAFDFWLNEMVEWSEKNDIENEQTLFILSMLTILWVGYQLATPISRQLALELLEVPNWEKTEDKQLYLPPKYGELELEVLLELASKTDLDI